MQRAHACAHAQWKTRLLGRAARSSRPSLVAAWLARCPAGPALLAPSRVASPLRCRVFALGRAGVRRASRGFRLRGGSLSLAIIPADWFGCSVCVLILGQVCPRNRTHTPQFTRSVCAVWTRRLRVLGDASTRHTLRSFTRDTRHSLRARREFVPPACPRRHEHSTQTLRSFTHATRHSLRVRPMIAASSPQTSGTHSARSTSPPWLRLPLMRRSPLRWARRNRGCAPLPRLLEKRFSLGATHPALLVYRLAPSPCGMTAAPNSRLLGRGLPEPPPSLVAAWLALSPCGLRGLLLLLVCGRRFASWRNPRRRPPVAGSAPFPQTRRLGPRSPPFATLRPRRGRRGQGA